MNKNDVYKITESISGYKEGTEVRIYDTEGDIKTLLVLNEEGLSTGEFIYGRKNKLEKVSK